MYRFLTRHILSWSHKKTIQTTEKQGRGKAQRLGLDKIIIHSKLDPIMIQQSEHYGELKHRGRIPNGDQY